MLSELTKCSMFAAVIAVAWRTAAGQAVPTGLDTAVAYAQATPADDSIRDETVARLAEYIRINTSNPPGNELQTAHWLKNFLASEGIDGQVLDTAELGPGRANFYARIKGDGSEPGIALVHHMDVVPVTPDLWSVDPFAGGIKDGYLWGRGTLDMKGHGIIQIMAVIALKRAGIRLHRDVVIIGNADEESDGDGAVTFVKRHSDLLQGIKYLLTESGDTQVENGHVKWWGINVGEKIPFWQRLTVHGVASHGSEPTPNNPVPRLARAIVRVSAWQTPPRVLPAVDRYFKTQAIYETGERRAWLMNARAALQSPRGRAWLLSNPDRNALLRNTISPTVLTGSNKTNVIPAQASAELDIRLLPDEDTAAFRRRLIQVIGDTAVHVETIDEVTPPFNAPLGTPLFDAIEGVIHEMLPNVPIASTVDAGASDRPIYAGAGLICYGLDPYLVELSESVRGVHGNDERVSIANVGWGVRFYRRLLTAFQ